MKSLNLKLNNLDDQSGQRIFKDICSNIGLMELDLSSNCFGNETAAAMGDFLSNSSCMLQKLDISVNNFDDTIFEMLKLCLNKNVSLQKFDIKNCKLKKENEKELIEIIIKHNLNNKKN